MCIDTVIRFIHRKKQFQCLNGLFLMLFFTSYAFSSASSENGIVNAVYYVENSRGMVNRVDLTYRNPIDTAELPDSIRLYWPDAMSASRMVYRTTMTIDPENGNLVSIQLLQPFTEGITRYDGSNGQLGLAYYSDPLASEASPEEIPFAIEDGVGPLLKSAMLVERLSAGDDSLVIQFTETVSLDVVAGTSLELIANGASTMLNVVSAGLYSDGLSIVAVVPTTGGFIPEEGDSLRIAPAGPVVDGEGNHAHQLNRPVVIMLRRVAPSITSAVYQDKNGDGSIDNVRISFNKHVELDSMFIKTIFNGVRGSDGEAVGAEYFTFDESAPNTVNFRISYDIFKPSVMKNRTSQSMQITAVFINYIDNNECAIAVMDGAAPVLVSFEYHIGRYTEKNGKDKDTIIAQYSETLTALPQVAQPFSFIDTNGVAYTAVVSGARLFGNEYQFIVDALIPAAVIPYGMNAGSEPEGKQDSVWINVSVAPEANAVDVYNNIQLSSQNQRIALTVVNFDSILQSYMREGTDTADDSVSSGGCSACGPGVMLSIIPPFFPYARVRCKKRKRNRRR